MDVTFGTFGNESRPPPPLDLIVRDFGANPFPTILPFSDGDLSPKLFLPNGELVLADKGVVFSEAFGADGDALVSLPILPPIDLVSNEVVALSDDLFASTSGSHSRSVLGPFFSKLPTETFFDWL